jgi:hypothetical protein
MRIAFMEPNVEALRGFRDCPSRIDSRSGLRRALLPAPAAPILAAAARRNCLLRIDPSLNILAHIIRKKLAA